jgi:dipeptidyl aminopeptidase/acylaminoacyl peptidase
MPAPILSGEGDPAFPSILNSRATEPIRLVYERYVPEANLWSLPLNSAGAKNPVRISCGPADAVANPAYAQFSPGGEKIAFVSRRSGFQEVWTCDTNSGVTTQLTSFRGRDPIAPRWSPDGRNLVFEVGHEIYISNVETGSLRRAAEGSDGRWPSWSHDGKWIFFSSQSSGMEGINRVPATGGPSEAVLSGPAMEPVESSDGRSLFYIKPNSGLWQRALDSGAERQILSGVTPGYWTIGPKGIFVLRPGYKGARSSVWYYDFGGARIAEIAELGKTAEIPGFSITRDGQSLLWAQCDHIDSDRVLELATVNPEHIREGRLAQLARPIAPWADAISRRF